MVCEVGGLGDIRDPQRWLPGVCQQRKRQWMLWTVRKSTAHFWELQFRWVESTGRCKVRLDSMGIKGKEMRQVVGLGWREKGDKNAVFETQMCLECVG